MREPVIFTKRLKLDGVASADGKEAYYVAPGMTRSQVRNPGRESKVFQQSKSHYEVHFDHFDGVGFRS